MDGGASVSRTITVPELAEAVVAATAPDQLELLPEVTAVWRSGDLARAKDGKWLGGSIGFGVDPGLTVMVIYPIIIGAMAQLLGTVAASSSQRLVDRLRRKRSKPPAIVPPAILDRAEQMRSACLAQALEAGLPESRATLLADALYGYLVRTTASGAGSGHASSR
jgi:hypothetical protein